MFAPIQKILPKAISALGISQEARAALVCEKYRKLAPRFIHANALQNTTPKFFKNGALTIGVTNAAWAARIAERQKELILAVNESLGKPLVKNIRTKVVDQLG